MKNWQYIGTILTGIAALITAGVGLYDKMHTIHKEVYGPFVVENKKKRKYGIVDDKDGWVNLREDPDVSSTSLARILNGTNLEILDKNGNWFKVYTESGRIGYVYEDRLIVSEYQK